MLFSENFKIALRALRANKLRSVLTMLGIVIGVATVVALLSIGKGATASITSSIQSNGSNLLTLSPGSSRLADLQERVVGHSRRVICIMPIINCSSIRW